MKRLVLPFVVLTLVTAVFGLGQIGSTVSYFSDFEKSVANVLLAGNFSFTVEPNVQNVDLELGGTVDLTQTLVPGAGSFPVKYTILANKVGGADSFCNALYATATGTPFVYNGPLQSLNFAPATSTAPWTMEVGLSDVSGLTIGDTCDIDLVYQGSVDGATGGYSDQQTEALHLTLTSVPEQILILNTPLFNQDELDLGDTGTSTDATSTDPIIKEPDAPGGDNVGTTTDATTTDEIITEPDTPTPPPPGDDATSTDATSTNVVQ